MKILLKNIFYSNMIVFFFCWPLKNFVNFTIFFNSKSGALVLAVAQETPKPPLPSDPHASIAQSAQKNSALSWLDPPNPTRLRSCFRCF